MGDSPLPDGLSAAEHEALRRAAKDEIRKRLAALRRTLRAEVRATYAASACQLLSKIEVWERARAIAGYAPLRFELDPSLALQRALTQGVTVALPRVVGAALTLHAISSFDGLVRSSLGIAEPASDMPELAPDTIDLVLVPAIAFDARGYRLGFGHGYYDRFLPRCRSAVKVGLCYELSLIAEVPQTADDIAVDMIVTERRVIDCGHS